MSEWVRGKGRNGGMETETRGYREGRGGEGREGCDVSLYIYIYIYMFLGSMKREM